MLLTAKASIDIKASVAKVWEALTTPALIKQYFFGTEAVSDWKVGSPLIFKGEWEGKSYEDKGTILASEAPTLFKYNYWSSMSDKPDLPENYATITYALTDNGGSTTLDILQDSVATQEAAEHSEQNWGYVLNSLKEMLEK